jgi:hypothetical protein
LGNLLKNYIFASSEKPLGSDIKRKLKGETYHCLKFAGLTDSTKAASPPEERMETNPVHLEASPLNKHHPPPNNTI